ncbi:MAG: HEPN domain-containing protein [Pseudomonadota bacterium]|nr:HEPN domain-containing protein [Pseudomonadota bacterium]
MDESFFARPKPPLTPEKLAEITARWNGYEARLTRARERVATHCVGGAAWYFGFVGATTNFERLPLGWMTIQQVVEPPEEIALAAALRDKRDLGGFARHAARLSFELVVPEPDGKPDLPFSVAWWVQCCLVLRASGEFLVPVVANTSWSTVSGCEQDTVAAKILDDYPKATRSGEAPVFTPEDVVWAAANFMKVGSVLSDARFGMAMTALTTHHHQGSFRMNAASLWAGIEAVFGISQELTFRLSLLLAAFLEPRGDGRLDLYKKVKKLYGVRSQAVHGGKMSDEDLRKHIAEVRALLARLLTKFVEDERVPATEDFERHLLSG